MGATLKLLFPKPGFFLMDGRIEVRLDGQVVYEGSFLEGFERETEVAAGPHRVEAAIFLGSIVRRRTWDVELLGGLSTATLRYSRLWGNFTRKLELISAAMAPPITPR